MLTRAVPPAPQVAPLLSAGFASLMALKNGFTSSAIADAAIGGVTTAMSAIFILLAVGALIGSWNMADDPDGRELRRPAAQPDDLLSDDSRDLRGGRHGDGLLDDPKVTHPSGRRRRRFVGAPSRRTGAHERSSGSRKVRLICTIHRARPFVEI